jgi:mannosyltransferase OCH1-like enzyme
MENISLDGIVINDNPIQLRIICEESKIWHTKQNKNVKHVYYMRYILFAFHAMYMLFLII